MELIVKLQLEGDSKIGLKFPKEYEAVGMYEKLISGQDKNSFTLSVELKKDKLNLVLSSEQNGVKTHYKDVSYTPEQIKKLMIGLDLEKSFQFLHVYSKNNVLTVAKPFRSQIFISLKKIEILNPVNL